MEFIIISGLSGAGKSKVASFLEDIGFYVVDNMPAPLMPKFAELCMAGPGRYDGWPWSPISGAARPSMGCLTPSTSCTAWAVRIKSSLWRPA